MRKKIIPLLIAVCFTATAQNNSTTASQASIYITHVTVIDTETGKQAADQTVMISEGRISDVASSQNVAVPANAQMVNGHGKYLIPGLWDMHVHGTRFDNTLPLYIANGVTGVREMFGPPDANKFRAELAAKHLIAPHIYLGSPIVDGKPAIVPDSIEVTTADEARKAVDEQKLRGADFIKVYSLLSRDAYFAIIDEARRQNIPVAGHVPSSVSVWEATAAKQRTIEHLFGVELGCSNREKDLRRKFLTANPFKNEWDALLLETWQSYSEDRCQRLFTELKKNGTWPVPTLAVRHSFGLLNDPQFTSDNRVRYFSGEFRDWVTGKFDARMKESAANFQVIRKTFSAESRITGELFRAGVPMLAGTDVGNPFCFPGFSLHDELALLVESGLTPLAALQAATRNAAIFMNATDRYGSVAKGKVADLVLLDADPVQDIHNTTKISEVFLGGKELRRAALDELLKKAKTAANASDQQTPSPIPEMQKLFNAQLGRWSQREERPDGSMGEGEATWRPGPGGMSLIENEFIRNSTGEMSGLSVTWYDQDAHGYRALWCSNRVKNGCLVMSKLAQWEGDQFVLRDEFESNGKKLAYKEVESGITPTTYTLTSYLGEPSGVLKPTSTIHATKISEENTNTSDVPAEAELRAFMAELRKASIEGDVDTIANSMTDDYVQTDINGYRQDKTTWLNEYFRPLADLIKAGKFHWVEFEGTNLQFRFYGHCAIVTGELHAKATGARPGAHAWVPDPNASFSGTLHFTHVYIKQNGKWMLAALHNQMPLPPANAAK